MGVCCVTGNKRKDKNGNGKNEVKINTNKVNDTKNEDITSNNNNLNDKNEDNKNINEDNNNQFNKYEIKIIDGEIINPNNQDKIKENQNNDSQILKKNIPNNNLNSVEKDNLSNNKINNENNDNQKTTPYLLEGSTIHNHNNNSNIMNQQINPLNNYNNAYKFYNSLKNQNNEEEKKEEAGYETCFKILSSNLDSKQNTNILKNPIEKNMSKFAQSQNPFDNLDNNIEGQKKDENLNDENKMSNNINKDYYKNFKNNSIYSIGCPFCKSRIPKIEKVEYDTNKNDFIIWYICSCNKTNDKTKKAYFRELLFDKEINNFCIKHDSEELMFFCKDCNNQICNKCKEEHKSHLIENFSCISEENKSKMLRISEQNKGQFEGDKLIKSLFQSNVEKNFEDFPQNNELFINSGFNGINSQFMSKKPKQNEFEDKRQKTNSNAENKSDDRKANFEINDKVNDSEYKQLNQLNKEKKNNIIIENSPNNNNSNYSKNNIKFKCIKTLEGHSEKIISLIQLNSGYIATGSNDLSVRIWDIEKEECVLSFKEKGNILCMLEFEPQKLLSGTNDNKIYLRDLNNPKDVIALFDKHTYWVNCLVKCDEKYFASASNDESIIIWDYYNKNIVSQLFGHAQGVLSLIKLNNGNLCSGSADSTIKIWDIKKFCCLMELKSHKIKCLYQLKDDTLLSGSDDSTIKIWKNFQCVKTLIGHENPVRTFCQIDDNHFASGSFDKTIRIWDINSMKNVEILNGHKSSVICLIKLKDGRLASSSSDKTIKIWE